MNTTDTTMIEGQGHVPALTEIRKYPNHPETAWNVTTRIGDVVRGWDITNGGTHVGTVERITYFHPGTHDVRVSIRQYDGRTRTVLV